MIKKTINRIKYISQKYNNIKVAFSGGKDSVVLYDLCKKVNLKANFVYQNTTIDPPGTLSFIRNNFPDVKIEHPELSFFKLVEKKGLPNRFQRWCCQYLKESNNLGYDFIVLGVRRKESFKRSKRKILEKYKGELHFNPLIDWKENDIWNYINKYNLPMIKYYSAPYNFKRHGCVMCPLASSKQQIKEATLFPKYLKALLKAVKIFRETHQHLQFVKDYSNEYEMVYLWLKQELNFTGRQKTKNTIFKFSAKEIIEDIFFSNCT